MADVDVSRSLETMAEPFEARLWGTFSARRTSDGEEVTPRGRKARALLAFLLIEPGPVARERLAGLLWSERGQAQAQGSLRTCLTELRGFSEVLDAGRQHLALRPGAFRLDVDEMKEAAEAGDAARLAGLLVGGSRILDDFDGIDPAFDQWLRVVRAERGERLARLAESGGRAAIAADEPAAALELARTLQRVDPLDEEAARLAMEAAHRLGKVDMVRRIHDALAGDLREQLGVAPSPETEALHGRLTELPVRGSPEPVRPPSGAPVVVVGAGAIGSPARSWRRRRPMIVAAAVLLLAGLAGAALLFASFRGGEARAQPVSIAVLPFRDLSDDPFFADGLAEEILARLAREPELRVAGRTSSALFRDRAADLRDVGRRLDVDYVLEGSVRRAGENVRIHVALVDTDDGMRLWTRSFHGRLDDIFAIQDRIGREVAGSLRLRFVGAQAPAAAAGGEVHALHLTARGLIRTRNREQLILAAGLLRRAVRLDPNSAPAWASLAQATRLIYVDDLGARDAEAMRQVDRALALAPDLAEAHAIKGLITGFSAEAVRHLEHAVQLDPNHAEAWHWLANARSSQGDHDGAFDAVRRVAELDPFWFNSRGFADQAWTRGLRAESVRFDENLARNHPDPSHRELARARIASRRGDWSASALHLRRAAALDSGDSRGPITGEYNEVVILLGLSHDHLLDLAAFERMFGRQAVDAWRAVMRGELPPVTALDSMLQSPRNFWAFDGWNQAAMRLMLNQGRGGDIRHYFDAAFSSAEGMASDGAYHGLAANAPLVAIALREGERAHEAERLLRIADRRFCRNAHRAGISFEILVECSRIWAVQGRSRLALAALRRAVALGWPYGALPSETWQPTPSITEDPAWRSIHGDAWFRRLDAALRAHLAREGRELEEALRRG